MKYTEEEFVEAVKSSLSVSQVLLKIGLVPAGGNYGTFWRKAKEFGVDTSHFRGQGWLKGRTHSHVRKQSLGSLLKEGTHTNSDRLRRRLIVEGRRSHKCESCGLTSWLGEPIPLELDHINGVRDDNRIENLQILCPNCHALTPTYRGRNISKK